MVGYVFVYIKHMMFVYKIFVFLEWIMLTRYGGLKNNIQIRSTILTSEYENSNVLFMSL